jgi:hypothetical protein
MPFRTAHGGVGRPRFVVVAGGGCVYDAANGTAGRGVAKSPRMVLRIGSVKVPTGYRGRGRGDWIHDPFGAEASLGAGAGKV